MMEPFFKVLDRYEHNNLYNVEYVLFDNKYTINGVDEKTCDEKIVNHIKNVMANISKESSIIKKLSQPKYDIYYTDNPNGIIIICETILNRYKLYPNEATFLSLDIEKQIKPNNKSEVKRKKDESRDISLISFCMNDVCFIINVFACRKKYEMIPESLRNLLKHHKIIKLVFSNNDERMLIEDYNKYVLNASINIELMGIIKFNENNISLNKLSQLLLKNDDKFKGNHDNYDNPDDESIIYSAQDVYLTYNCYTKMVKVDNNIKYKKYFNDKINFYLTAIHKKISK